MVIGCRVLSTVTHGHISWESTGVNAPEQPQASVKMPLAVATRNELQIHCLMITV